MPTPKVDEATPAPLVQAMATLRVVHDLDRQAMDALRRGDRATASVLASRLLALCDGLGRLLATSCTDSEVADSSCH